MKKELAGESPSMLENLLAQRIAVCWLQTSFYDGQFAEMQKMSLKQAKALQSHQDAAHRRLPVGDPGSGKGPQVADASEIAD